MRVSRVRGDSAALAPRGVLENLILKGVSLGLERGCRLALTLASAPILGEASFGRFVFASTVTAIVALAADLGLGIWTTRALARGSPAARQVVRTGLSLRGLMTVPFALAVGAIATVAGDVRTARAVALLGVAALFNGFADHFGAVLRGTERFAAEARLNVVRAGLIVGAGALALAIDRSLTGLCLALAAASLLAFLYGLVPLLRAYPGAGIHSLSPPMVRAALRESLPIWVASLLSLLYFKVDTFFVRGLAGDAELGAYGAAYKLFEGAMLLPAVILAVTFPRLVRASEPDARRLERRLAGALLGAGLVIGATLFAGRRPLVELVFGAGFSRAEDSLRILALGLPLVFLNFGLTHFLVARHRERVNTALALMMLVVTLLLDVLLVPRGSGPGAALATVLAEVFLTAGCLVALRGGAAGPASPPEAPGGARTAQTSA